MNRPHDAFTGPHLRRASDRAAPDRRLGSREAANSPRYLLFGTYTPSRTTRRYVLGLSREAGLTLQHPPPLASATPGRHRIFSLEDKCLSPRGPHRRLAS